MPSGGAGPGVLRPGRRTADGGPLGAGALVVALLGCVAVAAVSLLWSHTLTYDPWSWLVWGREVIHGSLLTGAGGTSWKPLPVIVDTLFAPLGRAAPGLWLLVARSGSLMALVFAFRLATRAAGRLAGGLAVAWIVLSSHAGFAFGWYGFFAAGWTEGLLIAGALGALDAHVMGRPRWALAAWFTAALIRPEAAVFLVLYGLLAGRRRRRLWWWAGGLAVAVIVLWLVPDYLGSGQLFSGSRQALQDVPPSIRHAADPGLRDVALMRDLIAIPVLVGLVLAVVLAGGGLRRLVVAALAGALAWLGIIAIMTQAGYPGLPRFFVAAIAILCVVAGVGWGMVTERVPARPLALVTAAIVAVNVVFLAGHVSDLDHQRRQASYEVTLNGQLTAVLARLGGAAEVRRCGPVATNPLEVSVLSWELGLGSRVADHAGPAGTVLQTTVLGQHVRLPRLRRAGGLPLVLVLGRWRVYQRCRAA